MPGKDSGEKSYVGEKLISLGIVMLVIFILLWFANESLADSVSTPVAFVPPTSTFPAPDPGIIGVQWADVVVSAENANPFDAFSVNEVVVRVSDSSHVDDGADGRLIVPCENGKSIYAWAPGYKIRSVPCDGSDPYRITLTHLEAIDNSYYLWSSALGDCNTCHAGQFVPNPPNATFDEMNEWFKSGHGKVFNRKYFETMYKGTSVSGLSSIPAQPVIIDNEWVPVPPEISHLYHGPGFRLDFPFQAGNCAYCHVPAAIQASQESIDLINLFPPSGGIWSEGVTCDICHKVFEVIRADDGNPFPDKPGILSYRFLRPNNGIFITGPFSNVLTQPKEGFNLTANHESTCTPLFSQSEFCAPCHFGKFGDMVVYNSYGEWRESPFAENPYDANYRTCQDCHMSHMDVDDLTTQSWQRQACSAHNTDFQNFDHNMMDFGPASQDGIQLDIPRMVKGAAEIGVSFGTEGAGPNTLDVNVMVTNKKAGHKFPTDSPLRHLILVVKVQDRVNTELIQIGGERIPNWAGPGPVTANIVEDMNRYGIRDYSGLPGKIFANLLVEEETNLSPGMAYWNETKHASVDLGTGRTSDTRLEPRKPDSSTYSFAMPDEGDVTVTVRLMYRFAFYDLAVWKEWFDRPDILVTEVICKGTPREPIQMTCRQTDPLPPTPTPTP